jgi:lipoprotein-anchoring transpeptidase ErfK/SrfK
MKATFSNMILFMGFGAAIWGAYHYKTAGQGSSPLLSHATAEESQPSPVQGPAVDQKNSPEIKAEKTHPGSGTTQPGQQAAAKVDQHPNQAEPSSSKIQKLFEDAQTLYKSEPMRGLFKLESLAMNYPKSAEASAVKAQMAGIATAAHAEGAVAMKRQDYLTARQAYSRAFFASWSQEQRDAIVKTLAVVNQKYLYSRKPVEGVEVYKVAPGDSLGKIAKKKGINWLTLKRTNKLKSHVIRVGQRLRILTGTFGVEISKERFELVLTHNGAVYKHFYVAIGKEDRTPVGQFTVEERIIKPTWYGPEGVYPFGHEKNVLGTRWLGFNRTEECSGFGIHGTKFPNSIKTKASMGCIRMRNENVEDLFDFIPKGCAVTIR